MYANQGSSRRDFGKAVLDGMETSLATIGKGVRLSKVVLLAQGLPIVLLTFRQHQHHLHFPVILKETFDGAHQDGFAANGQELLGNVTTHTKSLATCYYDYCFQDKLKVKN